MGEISEEEKNGALKFEVTQGTGDNKVWVKADGTTSKDKVELTLSSFTKGDDGKYTLTINQVPVGSYDVKETTIGVDGKDMTVSYSLNGGDKQTGDGTAATVTKNGNTTVDFEDEFTQQTGNLIITKTIKGEISEEEKNGALKFEVTQGTGDSMVWLNPDGTTSTEIVELKLKDFTLGDDGKYTLTINQIPVGSYDVKETTIGPDGLDMTVSYSLNGGEKTTGDGTAATVSKNADTTVDFEDEFTLQTGKFVLTKTIEGEISEEEKNGALKFEVTQGTGTDKIWLKPDGTTTKTQTVLTLKDFTQGSDGKYTLTIDKVPVGSYDVAETTIGPDGKDMTVSYSLNGGAKTAGASTPAEVKKDATTTVAFEDKFTDKPTTPNSPPPTYVNILKLRKTNGKIPANPKYVEGAVLHIEDMNGNTVKDCETGKDAAWTTKDNENHAVALNPGTYKLVEDAVPTKLRDYYTIADEITFTVGADGTVTGEDVSNNTITMYDDFNLSAYNEDQANANRSNKNATATPTQKRSNTNNTTTGGTSGSGYSSSSSRTTSVRTGDPNNAALPIAAGLIAVIAAAYVLLDAKKRRKG